MTIFGKPLSDYVAFQKTLLILIAVVGVSRLALSMAGAPTSIVKWVSLSAMALVGLIYCAVKVPKTGFGTYKHLWPLYVMQAGVAQVIAASAIILAIFTGADNIYSLPEYSGGTDGKTWLHAGAHLILGTFVGSFLAWIVGSGVMFLVKKLSPSRSYSTV